MAIEKDQLQVSSLGVPWRKRWVHWVTQADGDQNHYLSPISAPSRHGCAKCHYQHRDWMEICITLYNSMYICIYICVYIYICIILKLKTTTLYTEIENHNYCCEEKLRHTGHKPPICGCATARQANVDDTRCFSRCHATGQNQLFKPASISIWQSRKGWDMGGFHSHGGIPKSLDGLFHRKSSKNRWFEATPKSSMLIWFSIINHQFWGTRNHPNVYGKPI